MIDKSGAKSVPVPVLYLTRTTVRYKTVKFPLPVGHLPLRSAKAPMSNYPSAPIVQELWGIVQ